ncbi:uncharacterized protein [Littorina saxatilis]|uniref:uncharacterized protein n=1 Tax=Littorina saxatilis TaxID=31220 RepID=UPI0038B45F49
MEGKRNRLKRKPKVSPIPQQSKEAPDVSQPQQTDVKPINTSVITIDDDGNSTSVGSAPSNTKLNQSPDNPGQQKGKDTALTTLTEVLLAIDRNRKRLPLELLPDLPPYQPPVAHKGDNLADLHGTFDDLPPLPKLCPCKLKRKRKDTLSPAPSTKPAQPASSTRESRIAHTDQQRKSCENSKNSLHKELGSKKMTTALHHLAKRMIQTEHVPGTSRESDFSSVFLPADVSVFEETNPGLSDLPLDKAASTMRMPSVSKSKSQVSQSQTKQKTPGSGRFPNLKEKTQSAGLFSKTSSVAPAHDEMNEFEETSTHRTTNFADNSIERRQKRPLSSSTSSQRNKTTSAKTVTKSLFSAKSKPIFSTVKQPQAGKSQPSISSFSFKPVSKGGSGSCSGSGNGVSRVMGRPPQSNSRETVAVSTSRGSGHSKGRESDVDGTTDSRKEGEGRVISCPLCQMAFSSALCQIDIDGHIAACLSANDDDITW